MDPRLGDIIQVLAGTHSIEESWSAIVSFLQRQGIDHPIYMDLTTPAAGREPLVLAAAPGWWREWYESEHAERFDPFVHCCFDFQPTMTGVSYVDMHTFLKPDERQFVIEAAATGAISGFSSTLRRVSPHGYAGWNFCSSEKRASFDRLFSERAGLLSLFGFVADQHLRRLKHPDASLVSPLSRRERECLLWLSRGLRTAEIAERIGIRPVTVDLHVRSARAKLKARTREHALAIALTTGQIAP